MYGYSIDYFSWDRSPEKPGHGHALPVAASERTPKLKGVMLEIGITLGVALAFAFVVSLALKLTAIT